MPPSGVVMCADDFGLTEGVSLGIVDLIDMERLSATGAMTNMRWWRPLAQHLAHRPDLGVGLHLNLTTGSPIGRMPTLAPNRFFPKHGELLVRSLAGSLPKSEIREEIERQLDAFEEALGRPPDFVDGHQHVHVLPGIRRQLLTTLKRRGLAGRLWLRDPSDRVSAILRRGVSVNKALVVRALAKGFRRAARRAGFDTNDGFSGFSDFNSDRPVERIFQRSFIRLGRRPVVMCHPGYVDDELERLDPVVATRSRELMYLSSERFIDLLEVMEVRLVPRPV